MTNSTEHQSQGLSKGTALIKWQNSVPFLLSTNPQRPRGRICTEAMTVPFANTSPAPEPRKAPPQGLHRYHSLPHIWLMNRTKPSSEQLFSAFIQLEFNSCFRFKEAPKSLKCACFPRSISRYNKSYYLSLQTTSFWPGMWVSSSRGEYQPSLAHTSQQKALWDFVLNWKEARKLNHKWVFPKRDAPAPRAANSHTTAKDYWPIYIINQPPAINNQPSHTRPVACPEPSTFNEVSLEVNVPKVGGSEWATNTNIDFFWHYLGQNPPAKGALWAGALSMFLWKISRMLNFTLNLKYKSEVYFAQALLKKQFIIAFNLPDIRKGDFSLLISCVEAMTN